MNDEAYIIQTVIPSYWVNEALKEETFKNQIECLRKRIVDSSPVGYKNPGPYYFTGKGVITLCDELNPRRNERSYSIVKMAKLALGRDDLPKKEKYKTINRYGDILSERYYILPREGSPKPPTIKTPCWLSSPDEIVLTYPTQDEEDVHEAGCPECGGDVISAVLQPPKMDIAYWFCLCGHHWETHRGIFYIEKQEEKVFMKKQKSTSLFSEKDKKTRGLHVSQDVLEKFADMNSCQSLDMYDHNKSRAQVIDYLKRKWICGGSVSRGSKTLSVNLYECIPLEQYEGEFNDPHDEDADFYKGGRFRSRDGRWWVMTGYEIEVLPLKKGNSLFIKEKL